MSNEENARPRLVIGPSWVGDMVMTQSLLVALKKNHPDSPLDVMCPGWSLPVIRRMPQVRRPIEMPIGHGEFRWRDRYRLGRKLRKEHYLQAYILPRSFKAALIPFHANIPVRTGYLGELRYGLLNDIRSADRAVLNTTTARFVALGMAKDFTGAVEVRPPALAVDYANQERLIARLDLDPYGKIVALLPGAEYGPAKCWPLDYYHRLADELVSQGIAVWVLGSQKDRAAGEAIAEGIGAVRNLCGSTELEDAIDILGLASAAVSNDSGLMHIAAAVGIPLVAIYGSSSPKNTPPLSAKAQTFYLDLECSPCFKRECPLGHLNCLRNIGPDQVLGALNTVLT
jgi:heptosyltransferase-2